MMDLDNEAQPLSLSNLRGAMKSVVITLAVLMTSALAADVSGGVQTGKDVPSVANQVETQHLRDGQQEDVNSKDQKKEWGFFRPWGLWGGGCGLGLGCGWGLGGWGLGGCGGCI
jgi:hypothetical protein